MKNINHMNWTRTIITGIILWIIIFFEVSILMFGFKLDGAAYNITHYIVLAVILIVVGLVYFKGEDVKTGVVEGLLVGFIFVAIGIILDAIITVPLFTYDYSFFLNPYLWIGYLEIILILAIIGEASK